MSFRTIYISNGNKISLKLNNLILNKEGINISIPIEDINAIILDNPHTLFSVQLFSELTNNNILILICNEKHLPSAQLLPLHNNTRQTKLILQQIEWSENKKQLLWQEIVKCKIHNQKFNLIQQECDKEDVSYLENFENSVQIGDLTNREGLAAKKYFKSIFGKEFVRESETLINAALDYSYAILSSTIARSLSAKGLILPIGIHHKSEYNHYSLACDLMEPFRPIFDFHIINLLTNKTDLDAQFKAQICNIINEKVLINNKNTSISNAIDIYIEEFMRFMCGDSNLFDKKFFPLFVNDKEGIL
jgi:CRISPR-associated protein Cas1